MLNQRSIVHIIVFFILVMLCFNCSDDKNPAKQNDEKLIGTWELFNLTIFENDTVVIDEAWLHEIGAYWFLELENDNTFESNYNLDFNEIETGTWSTSGNELRMVFNSEDTMVFEYSLNEDVLKLDWIEIDEDDQERLIAEFKRI